MGSSALMMVCSHPIGLRRKHLSTIMFKGEMIMSRWKGLCIVSYLTKFILVLSVLYFEFYGVLKVIPNESLYIINPCILVVRHPTETLKFDPG